MKLIKKIARDFILPASLKLGLDSLFLSRTSKSCCIVNFHGVRKNSKVVFNNRHMPVDEFEKVIIYLRKKYKIVPLAELFEIHRSKKKAHEKTIALTFDDGYLNNFEIALPVLQKYKVPATFYIITKSLTDDNYLAWPDVIDLIKKDHPENIELNGYIFPYPGFYNEKLKMDLPAYLKTCGDQTEPLAYELHKKNKKAANEIQNSGELLKLISADKIKKYKDDPLVEFGSHSHSHFNFEYLRPEVATKELTQSKQLIEELIGKKIISIAFPDGSYLPATVKLAKEAGYQNIAAVEYRHQENNTDPNLLARFTISNSTTYESNALRLAKQFDEYGF